jgi:hypothetical protein
MKLAKLSLAAIVAAGALTTVNAKPLEEAIKGVEISGFVRYRFYAEDGALDAKGDRHRFSVPVSLVAPVAENLTAGVSVRAEQNEYGANGAISDEFESDTIKDNDKFAMTKAWFKYATKDFSVRAGKFELATPWTDPGYAGNRGTGALAMYTGVPGWAFAAAAFTQTNTSVTVGKLALKAMLASPNPPSMPGLTAGNNGIDVGEENLYAVAAIGAVGPVNVQAWFSSMTNVFDSSIFVQADAKFAGFGLKAQANQLKLADETKGLFADDSGLFWAVEGSYAIDGFSVDAGYISNDDDQPIHTLSADDATQIKFGKQLVYETTNMPAAETIYANAGFATGPYSVGVGYGTAELDGEDFADEFYVQAGYKYSKNFNTVVYYSDMDIDGFGDEADNKEIRFEAKYSF